MPHPTKSESVAPESKNCAILVTGSASYQLNLDSPLSQLSAQGYAIRFVWSASPGEDVYSRMASHALRDGFRELFWIDSNIIFDPSHVEQLRSRPEPLICGLYPNRSRRQLACHPLPGSHSIPCGPTGGVFEFLYTGFGFVFTRRHLYEKMQRALNLPTCNEQFDAPVVPYFQPMTVDYCGKPWYLPADYSFCERARQCGFKILIDTRIQLSVVEKCQLNCSDVGVVNDQIVFKTATPPPQVPKSEPSIRRVVSSGAKEQPKTSNVWVPARNQLHQVPIPLRSDFPRLRAYAVTYSANLPSVQATRSNFSESDWDDDLEVFVQPPDWPISYQSSSQNYRRALEAAATSDCDFALFLEDDVRVCRRLRQNLLTIPLVHRDQCDFLSLYIPDLVQSPWERQEPHLGYRLARPLYSGPNRLWEKHRLWGAQAYVLSRRLIYACLERWDRLKEAIDSRVISVCSELKLPMWYSAPCLVQHSPLKSAFSTPTALAPDFDANYRLEMKDGFQPPEEIPGWLSLEEGRLLHKLGRDCDVMELGTGQGRSTVCLAQQARSLVSIDTEDQSEALEWSRRYGLARKIDFRKGDCKVVCESLTHQRFDLAFIDTVQDAASVTRDIECVLPLLKPEGLIAFHDYPDPGWPDVRRVVDDFAQRFNWHRVAQADYLGVFKLTP